MARFSPRFLLGIAFAAGINPALAHDLWVEASSNQESGDYQLRYGHHPQVSHHRARQIRYDPEIVKTKDGDKLRVRVLADGKPAPGAIVMYDGKPRGETGTDGALHIRIRHPGLQLIQATAHTPHAGPEAEEVVHTTALTFSPIREPGSAQ